jgi:hypothetical protein
MIRKIIIGLMMVGLIFMLGCENVAVDEDDVFCTEEYAPVCGIDGNTYSNKCYAGKTEIAYEGECGDFEAMLAREPFICTREYMPVCGEDGITYSNKCEAGNMTIAHAGECSNEDKKENSKIPELACNELEGTWIDIANECEGISEEQCINLGGNYNTCASACRNDPEAIMCTMQCVFVCEFN